MYASAVLNHRRALTHTSSTGKHLTYMMLFWVFNLVFSSLISVFFSLVCVLCLEKIAVLMITVFHTVCLREEVIKLITHSSYYVILKLACFLYRYQVLQSKTGGSI